MRISEIHAQPGMGDRFNIDRMESRRNAIVRKAAGVSLDPSDGYRHGITVDLITRLMRGSDDADAVYDLIDRLPGAARLYLMKHVVKVNRDGSHNPAYRDDTVN